jgi:multiphosphoryl transfer protein
MVGLVIVSHSRALAQALLELAKQVANTRLPLALAAGVGPGRDEFGTDAVEISEAIQSVYSPEGVVVLMDLGSAVLSAQMALDLLPPGMAAGVHFCAAPLVEGCIAAAVQIGLGSRAETVCQEAANALLPKREQLAPPATMPAPAAPPPAATLEITLTLKNRYGLHARPAARFVQLASTFDATIQVRNARTGKGPVPARSLNGLATLGAVGGDAITIAASGTQAQPALEALRQLVEDGFGEPEAKAGPAQPPGTAPAPPASALEGGLLQAVPISPGIAFGPLLPLLPARPEVTNIRVDDPALAWQELHQALQTTRQVVGEQRRRTARSLGEQQAAIFDAHRLILEDPQLLEQARQAIFAQKLNPAAAWAQAIRGIQQAYQQLADPYLRQRALDVADLGDQVLFALAGKTGSPQIALETPSILLADELSPAQTAALDLRKILGLVTTGGGPTSHSAILARAMGIPAVAGVGPALNATPPGAVVALDGTRGQVWLAPSPAELSQLVEQRQAWQASQAEFLRSSQQAAITRDGRRVEVAANAASLAEAELALKNGAEGIGLLRTEFLFLTRQTPPGEEEQYQKLAQIIGRLQNLPVIVRTLDAGGDKELPYLELAAEANPFLGVRAIRLCFQEPELFRTQLRAILRAGQAGHLRIMFPMVAGLDEVLQARQFVEEAHRALLAEGIPHAWPVEAGIMVEIPSAALLSETLAAQVDFFSIGTNDLTQYTLAAERGNPALSRLSDALHPAVLRLIQQVAAAAHAHAKWVGVCGELAGDLAAIPLLVGLGVDELSLAPAGIPAVKAAIRALDYSNAQSLAQRALACSDAVEVRNLIKLTTETQSPQRKD